MLQRKKQINMNIGIIGAGHIAKKMAKTINKLDGFSNYAIASRSLDKAEKFKNKYKFEKAYGSYEEMLKDSNVELVYIATPHSCHYEQMLLCLKYNKHVLCEKILTTSEEDTRDVYKKFEEKGLLLQEALWTSFMPSRNIINDLLYKDRIIGNIKQMDASFKVPLMNKERVIRKDLGGGALMDIGLYSVTFILRTLGFNYSNFKTTMIKRLKEVDSKENIEFYYENDVKGVAKSDGTFITSLIVKVKGDKGYLYTDMVNCPNIIFVFNKFFIIKKVIVCKPKYGGFEFELIACKKAIENDLIECNEWTHDNSIQLQHIIDTVLSN